jgi:hypothetical protein
MVVCENVVKIENVRFRAVGRRTTGIIRMLDPELGILHLTMESRNVRCFFSCF